MICYDEEKYHSLIYVSDLQCSEGLSQVLIKDKYM